MKVSVNTCPTCGKGTLSQKTETWTFKIKDESVAVPGVHVDVCGACGDEIADAAEVRRAELLAGKDPQDKRAVG